MAAIKKSIKVKPKTVTVEASAPLEEAVTKEEKRPPVTQVVEVVEEVPVSGTAVAPPVEPPKPMEMPPLTEQENVSSGTNESMPSTETGSAPNVQKPEEEKRKEMVDELFQNRQQNSSQVMPEISVHTTRSSKPIVLWAIVLIVACLVAGGSLLFLSGKKGITKLVAIPIPAATATPKITPTPEPTSVKRSDITIQVLNGGGKAGVATKMKTFLEGKGYTVSATGNADSYTYDKTVVAVKASKKVYISLLENDLKDTYTLGTSSASLDDSVPYDARVTVGKE